MNGYLLLLGEDAVEGGQVYLRWLSYLQQGHREEGGQERQLLLAGRGSPFPLSVKRQCGLKQS